MRRGEIWWASLPEPTGLSPGFRRPVLIVSANGFNESRINTVTTAVITSNLRLADAPGNVRLRASGTGLGRPSVVNDSRIITVDRALLTQRVGRVSQAIMAEVDEGLRLALSI